MTYSNALTDAQKLELAAAIRAAGLVPITAASGLVSTTGNGPGILVENAAGMEATRLEFGLAWLFRWLNGLKAQSVMSVGLIGDSNTAGYRGAILQTLLTQIPGITVVNYGEGGTTLNQFVNKTGPFASNGKALDAVLAAGHDLIVSSWDGTNTPAVDANGSPATFATDMDAMMAAIRGSANGSPGRCSVLLCTSSTQADGADWAPTTGSTWKRDALFKMFTRKIVTDAAKKWNCAFFDVGGRLPEAIVDFAGGSVGVNTWMTDNHLHTMNAHSDLLAQHMFEYLVPSVYRNMSIRQDCIPGAGGFLQPATIENMSTKRIMSHVFLEGRMNHAGKTIAKGDYMFSINARHRPRIQVWNAICQLFDGATQPMSPLRVNIQQDGQVIAAEAGAVTATSIRMRADWECVAY